MTTRGAQAEFAQWLSDIADRSAALRDALAAAAALDARVPGCPDWSTGDLAEHIGRVQRFWAAAVRAGAEGNAEGPPAREAILNPQPGADVVGWLAESATGLIEALHAAGPAAPCWTWWSGRGSVAPSTAAAVARHQVQEAAVHAYDAQEAMGAPAPIPSAVALDGVGEFLEVMAGSAGAWPHPPATVLLAATEGPAWLIRLGAHGIQLASDAAGEPDATVRSSAGEPDATVRGAASDLVLALYRRVPLSALDCAGDELIQRLVDWPDAN